LRNYGTGLLAVSARGTVSIGNGTNHNGGKSLGGNLDGTTVY
jgi:hypothetical protein